MDKTGLRAIGGPSEIATTFVPGLLLQSLLVSCFPVVERWIENRLQHQALDLMLYLAGCYLIGQILHTLSDCVLQRGLLCHSWGFPVHQLLGAAVAEPRGWRRFAPGRRRAYSAVFIKRLTELAEQRCAFVVSLPLSVNVARDFYWVVSHYVAHYMPDAFRTARRMIELYGFARNMAFAAILIGTFAICPGWECPLFAGSTPGHRTAWLVGWWAVAAIMYINYTQRLYRQNDFVLRAFAVQRAAPAEIAPPRSPLVRLPRAMG